MNLGYYWKISRRFTIVLLSAIAVGCSHNPSPQVKEQSLSSPKPIHQTALPTPTSTLDAALQLRTTKQCAQCTLQGADLKGVIGLKP